MPPPVSPSGVMDRPDGYGVVSRSLHWLMAALLAWQFTSAAVRQLLPETPIEAFFWSTHTSLGFLLLFLVLLRGVWALVNLGRRPDSGLLAGLGHLVLYLLMIAIPTLGILRAYARGGDIPRSASRFSARATRRSNPWSSLPMPGTGSWAGPCWR